MGRHANRSRPSSERSVALYDIEIDHTEGDGRVVIAYAATFDTLYPVRDFDFDYDETISRSAFNDALGLVLAGDAARRDRPSWLPPLVRH